jgi:3D (Asp-Asp-Asp) domain-containing protein
MAAVMLQATTTSYCLNGTMADGTQTRPRSAASNSLRLGTKIRITGRQAGPGGIRKYVIRDRIGYGTQLDLWTSSCYSARQFGRRTTTFKIGWAR